MTDFIYNVSDEDVLFYMDGNGIFLGHKNNAPSGIYGRVTESIEEWEDKLDELEKLFDKDSEDDDELFDHLTK